MQHDKAAFCAAHKAHGVGVGKRGRNDLLLICKTVYRTNAVTQLGSLLKAKLLRSEHHALVKLG